MSTTTNVNSSCQFITDARLAELMPTVPEGVTVNYYGHIRTTQTGYGMWRVTVELDINGATEKYSFRTNDEDLKLVLDGADYREFSYTAAEAADVALAQAIEENYAEVYNDLTAAAEVVESND
jgi:hypothetical protein